MTLECNSSSFKSCRPIFNSAMMSIGREIAWELHAYITEHGLDGAGWFYYNTWVNAQFCGSCDRNTRYAHIMNRRIEWPSSTLHALSMRTAFLHFIKSRSAVRRFTHNLQILEGVRIWKFHNICSGTHTFRLCENLETQNLTKNRGIRRFIW